MTGFRWQVAATALAVLITAAIAHGWIARSGGAAGADAAPVVGTAHMAVWLIAAVGLAAVATTGTLLDRTRRRIETDLIAARDRLHAQVEHEEERQRLHLLGALAAGLAHELGQPLSAARVGIEGIHYLRQLGREPDADHIQRTLARVGMNVLAMTQTIEHLRCLADAQETAELGPLDLATAVAAALGDRDQWARFSDVVVDWQAPAEPVPVLAEAAGIRLVLTNLLRNAVEAVQAQSTDRRVVRVRAGPGPVLTVHDSGPGIPADCLPRLFDPFFSTKGAARGIGLSLAKASAIRMRGQLSVASTPGSGTCFTLRLRAVTESG